MLAGSIYIYSQLILSFVHLIFFSFSHANTPQVLSFHLSVYYLPLGGCLHYKCGDTTSRSRKNCFISESSSSAVVVVVEDVADVIVIRG